MTTVSQGDIIRLPGFDVHFLVISKNAYIKTTETFHVCPIKQEEGSDPLHIFIKGVSGHVSGYAICEQIRLIDGRRTYKTADRIAYADIINISDAIQGVFEYD